MIANMISALSVTSGGTVSPPVILSGPQSQTVPAGSDVTLSVQASGSDLTYQWQHDGTNISGATTSALVLNDVQTSDGGTYTAIVSNGGGSVTTSATLTVTPIIVVDPPVITNGPDSQTVRSEEHTSELQ